MMKHSCNDDSGINMSSNEYDAMGWNDVLFEANNFTYYPHKTELRMQRYSMMNMAWKLHIFGDLGKFTSGKSQPGTEGSGTARYRTGTRAFGWPNWWIWSRPDRIWLRRNSGDLAALSGELPTSPVFLIKKKNRYGPIRTWHVATQYIIP